MATTLEEYKPPVETENGLWPFCKGMIAYHIPLLKVPGFPGCFSWLGICCFCLFMMLFTWVIVVVTCFTIILCCIGIFFLIIYIFWFILFIVALIIAGLYALVGLIRLMNANPPADGGNAK
mmetsp:Transcript_7373/g.10236  ORF Transcript_7373/g.10236 Transcript_7373/m.10236 type:complete len:121 (+) Transcript_7373:162-524(+)